MCIYHCLVVSNVPKILKWEQITTILFAIGLPCRCFQCSKDTKMGANHNNTPGLFAGRLVVSNVPKILKWEQITTQTPSELMAWCCFQCSKDTKMGANHNTVTLYFLKHEVVSNVPKILKWEQITTGGAPGLCPMKLFPMFQRY